MYYSKIEDTGVVVEFTTQHNEYYLENGRKDVAKYFLNITFDEIVDKLCSGGFFKQIRWLDNKTWRRQYRKLHHFLTCEAPSFIEIQEKDTYFNTDFHKIMTYDFNMKEILKYADEYLKLWKNYQKARALAKKEMKKLVKLATNLILKDKTDKKAEEFRNKIRVLNNLIKSKDKPAYCELIESIILTDLESKEEIVYLLYIIDFKNVPFGIIRDNFISIFRNKN